MASNCCNETSRITNGNDVSQDTAPNETSEKTTPDAKERRGTSQTVASIQPTHASPRHLVLDDINMELHCLNLFSRSLFDSAIEWYSHGISSRPNAPRDVFLVNRSVCYINLENYEAALSDANEIANSSPCYPTAVARKAIIYIKTKEYEKAMDVLKRNLHRDDPKKNLERLICRAYDLINQRDHGRYDMRFFHKTLGKAHNHLIADFKGLVKIINVRKRGRGLYLTTDVEAGELLLCSKAFAIYYFYREESSPLEKLVECVIERLTKHPDLGKELYLLWAGQKLKYLNPAKDNCATVDRERITSIVRFNARGSSHSDNAFSLGLWLLESYIKDDCINENCSATQYGNVRQIRSVRPMKRGDELHISSRNNPTFLGRRPRFENKFGCGCDLCVYESLEPKKSRMERDSILNVILELPGAIHTPETLMDAMSKIQNLSLISPFQQYYMVSPKIKLGVAYYLQKNFKEAIIVFKEFFSYCLISGISFADLQLDMSVYVFRCYMSLKNYKKAAAWRKEMQKWVKILYCCDDLSILCISKPQPQDDSYPSLTNLLTILDDVLSKK